MNNLIVNNNNEEVKITSKDLCNLINIFRREEGNETVKEHNDLMKSIRAELKALANAGIDGQGDFSQSSYTNKQGKIQPCFLMTEEAVMQMLNKESAVVRYKTQQYIKKLKEQKNSNELIEDYQSKYGLRRIRKTFTESIDPRKTYEEYLELSKAEYKSKRISGEDRIKASKIIIDSLEQKVADNISDMRGSELLAIQELLTDINKDLRILSNRRNGGRLAAKTKEINLLEDEVNYSTSDYYCIKRHAYTCNRMNIYNEQLKREVNTAGYKKWKENLNLSDFLPETYPDVDFSKDLKITLLFSYKKEFDLDNLQKTIIDSVQEFYSFDDNNIKEIKSRWLETVETYEDGCIWVRIENFEDNR